jgi:hypothetical protein
LAKFRIFFEAFKFEFFDVKKIGLYGAQELIAFYGGTPSLFPCC